MKKIFMIFIFLSSIMYANKGSENPNNCKIVINGEVKSCIVSVEADGVGVTPCNSCSVAQSKVMARRAAIIDAYRALAEKIYGIKVVGRDYVRNMILKNSIARSRVEGMIKGADIIYEELKDGVYTVRMSVNLNAKFWNNLFSITQ